MTAHSDEPTDTSVPLPWQPSVDAPRRDVPQLVIAWCLAEPERVGQVAPIQQPCWLGRGQEHEGGGDDGVRLSFFEQRPGQSVERGALTTTALSRKQLLFKPAAQGVEVRSVGRRQLLHNGSAVDECVVHDGDTLLLENTLLLLVSVRPLELPPMPHLRSPRFAFGEADEQKIVGESPAVWNLRGQLAAAAAGAEHILLLGDSGVGKELGAKALHALSSRRRGPFVARNAATLPQSLIDAELFGSARDYPNAGSPTRVGLVGVANRGTLLLDEVGELPEALQAHLLRVLDSGGEYHRLGDSEARRSDFRLVAATNRGRDALKHDFLARFGQQLTLPGLNARRSDIPFLVRHLLAEFSRRDLNVAMRFFEDRRASSARIDPALMERLLRLDYTLHMRQLASLLQTSIATSPTDHLRATPEVLSELEASHDLAGAAEAVPRREPPTPPEVQQALNACGGSVVTASKQLGISRHALRRLIHRHGIDLKA